MVYIFMLIGLYGGPAKQPKLGNYLYLNIFLSGRDWNDGAGLKRCSQVNSKKKNLISIGLYTDE